jgi:hydroxypyruvate reductase
VVTLLISDVPGDDPDVIASGPTVPDPSTCVDALAILDRYRIALPPVARAALESGRWETPKPGDACFAGQAVQLIATPQQSLEAAAALAREAGIEAHVLSDEIEGESRDIGGMHAALARAIVRRGAPFARPCVLLSGGETTVTVRAQDGPPGRGGRAGEFLRGCALALQGATGVHGLAADTDGIDGGEDNAWAIVTPDTLERARAAGLDAAASLARHARPGVYRALGDLVLTGPTSPTGHDVRAGLIA